MPWRLLGFILLAAVFLAFIGFNLENRCDVSFGFYTFSQVPVFLTAFFTLVLGMILALPLVISFRSRARRAGREDPDTGVQDPSTRNKKGKRKPETGGSDGID
jgi:uncharacterized integral membrane protein